MFHVIVAPHPDDEVIGCYEILKNKDRKVAIFYIEESSKLRNDEALKLKEHFESIKLQFFCPSIPTSFLNPDNIFYFPDPIFEKHFAHRTIGIYGENLLRHSNLNVQFYSTNMEAPYIHEVSNPEEKERILDLVYPSQKLLWSVDKKYILFEGR